MHSSHAPLRTHCQNCDTELKGPYCHRCGQHDFDEHRSFKSALHEALESFFHWDGKFFQGLYDLLFRPGYLSSEYYAGRRARHIPPLRFYIFVSVLFFLAPSASKEKQVKFNEENLSKLEQIQTVENNQPTKENAQVDKPSNANASTSHSTKEFGVHSKNKELEQLIKDKLKHREEIVEHFHHYLPRVVLCCLPLFALLLMAVFRKSGHTYLQYLVFALHLHAFFFLFTLSSGGWQQLLGLLSPTASSWLWIISCVYLFLYTYLALRRVFKVSGWKLVFRSSLIFCSYAFVLTVALGTAFVVAAMMV